MSEDKTIPGTNTPTSQVPPAPPSLRESITTGLKDRLSGKSKPCHQGIPPDAKFCPICGKRINNG